MKIGRTLISHQKESLEINPMSRENLRIKQCYQAMSKSFMVICLKTSRWRKTSHLLSKKSIKNLMKSYPTKSLQN